MRGRYQPRFVLRRIIPDADEGSVLQARRCFFPESAAIPAVSLSRRFRFFGGTLRGMSGGTGCWLCSMC